MSKLRVKKMFFGVNTEGPFCGVPAFFINLNKKGKKISVKKLVKEVNKLATTSMIVICGDDPFQQDFSELVYKLREDDFWFQYETSGRYPLKTLPLDLSGTRIVVTVQHDKIFKDIAANTLCFKYIISINTKIAANGLPVGLYEPDETRVMFTPEFSESVVDTFANIRFTEELCMQYGWTFTMPYNKLMKFKGIEE